MQSPPSFLPGSLHDCTSLCRQISEATTSLERDQLTQEARRCLVGCYVRLLALLNGRFFGYLEGLQLVDARKPLLSTYAGGEIWTVNEPALVPVVAAVLQRAPRQQFNTTEFALVRTDKYLPALLLTLWSLYPALTVEWQVDLPLPEYIQTINLVGPLIYSQSGAEGGRLVHWTFAPLAQQLEVLLRLRSPSFSLTRLLGWMRDNGFFENPEEEEQLTQCIRLRHAASLTRETAQEALAAYLQDEFIP